jgi:hypothetical protein
MPWAGFLYGLITPAPHPPIPQYLRIASEPRQSPPAGARSPSQPHPSALAHPSGRAASVHPTPLIPAQRALNRAEIPRGDRLAIPIAPRRYPIGQPTIHPDRTHSFSAHPSVAIPGGQSLPANRYRPASIGQSLPASLCTSNPRCDRRRYQVPMTQIRKNRRSRSWTEFELRYHEIV